MYSFSVSMVRRRISEAQIWQIIGMHTTASFKAIGPQMGYHYIVVSRLVRKHTQTNNVNDLPKCGRPRVTSDRDDRALQRLVRRMPFATSPVLKHHWLPNRRLSTRTVRNRLKSAEHNSRRVIKRPLLVDRHRRSPLAWCLARRGWNLRTWHKIHWSDESRFLLHVTDGRMRVWRHKNTAYSRRNIQPTVPYGGCSVMVWRCISHDCRLDLVTIQGYLTGDQYTRDVLQPVVVPHFNNHPLATRLVYMDDNARPRRSRAVTAYLQSEAVTSVPWPAMSPDLNPIEHIWDMLGRRIQAREPPVQNIRQLEATLHRELQQLSQQDIRRLTGGMRRRVEAVIQARGVYTRYWTLNNRCRQVIHKWCFESEMIILSCVLNCEGQYLKWTCFTAKTGLVIMWLNIH
jgi:transposase